MGVVYSSPGISAQEGSDLIEHIIDSQDQVCSAFPDCGIVITGDFNMLNVADLLSCHNLKQVVREPTRGNNILDLIITNMFHFYSTPTVTAPLGRSDHHVINWSRNTDSAACLIKKGITKRKVRRFTQSSCAAFGRWCSDHVWFSDVQHPDSANSFGFFFYI